MGKWGRQRVNPENLNNGNEYTQNDRLSIQQLNAIINSGLISQDFVENLSATPDVSNANNVGSPSVELVDNIVNGIIYKKFKFNNLKGERGEKGEKGDAGVVFEYDAETKILNIITE